MSLLLPPESKEFEKTPADTHVATCYRIIDLGTQVVDWQGETKQQHKIMVSWELPNALMEDGKPFTQHRRYTLSSSNKAALRKDLEAWRGVAFTDADFGSFDIGNVIGKSCLMGVVHETSPKGSVFANISFIGKLPKGMTVPELQNPTMYFSLNAFEQAKYDSLSEPLRATIALSPEYQKIMGSHKIADTAPDNHYRDDDRAALAGLDDEIPF